MILIAANYVCDIVNKNKSKIIGSMKHKRMSTTSGRIIDIYDDVFPSYLRSHHIFCAQESRYELGASSSFVQWQNNRTFFRSSYSHDDLNNFRFVNDELFSKLQNYDVHNCWILASSPLSSYYYHVDTSDENMISILYYVNTRWDRNWGGETLFANDDGECEIAVEYKPGRVVIFDSMIEHKPSAISMDADEFRFIFVMQMIRKTW